MFRVREDQQDSRARLEKLEQKERRCSDWLDFLWQLYFESTLFVLCVLLSGLYLQGEPGLGLPGPPGIPGPPGPPRSRSVPVSITTGSLLCFGISVFIIGLTALTTLIVNKIKAFLFLH